MKAKSRQSGLTLTEMTVVIVAAALLTSLSIPAIRTFFNSLASEGEVKSMISAALSSARAIAAKEQRYAGIRFQKAYRPEGPLEADQYMIFIVFEEPKEMTNLTNAFRAVEGLEPIKLPDNLGVMDLRYRTSSGSVYPGDAPIDENNDISNLDVLRDTTTFSIVFSPSGKLVIHDVRVRNRDGETDGSPVVSYDDVFNKDEKVEAGEAMFYQDDYANLGLGKESSRNSFVIYEKEKFRQAYEKGQAYSGYLYRLASDIIYINPYTGTIIKR